MRARCGQEPLCGFCEKGKAGQAGLGLAILNNFIRLLFSTPGMIKAGG